MEWAINRSATTILPQRSNCCYLFWDEFSHPPEPAANRSATSIPVLLLKSNFCYLFWDRLSHPPPPYFFWDQKCYYFFFGWIIPPAGASNLPLCHLHTSVEIKLLSPVLGWIIPPDGAGQVTALPPPYIFWDQIVVTCTIVSSQNQRGAMLPFQYSNPSINPIVLWSRSLPAGTARLMSALPAQEPPMPKVVTDVPGPKSKALLQ